MALTRIPIVRDLHFPRHLSHAALLKILNRADVHLTLLKEDIYKFEFRDRKKPGKKR
jgi:hypothetical protein